MVNNILTAAGVPFRRGRFTGKPKPSAYVVYMDDVSTDGSDEGPALYAHDITLELYTVKPDGQAEAAIEAAITAAGLQWTKQDLYWLETEQLYQVIYEFSYTEKRRA